MKILMVGLAVAVAIGLVVFVASAALIEAKSYIEFLFEQGARK